MSYSSEVLADSPLFWGRLGESSGTTLNDSSGNGRNGTYSGMTLGVTGATTDGDTAVRPASSGGYGKITGASWMDTANWTVEAWVNRGSDTSYGYIFTREAGPGQSVSTDYIWSLRVNGSGQAAVVIFKGGSAVFATGSATLSNNTWYHIAATLNGSTLTLYVNGVSVASDSSGGSISRSTATDMVVCNVETTAGGNLDSGKTAYATDEVAFYGTALSAARILAHYNAGISSAVDGTVAATLPSLTASVAGTHTSNDRTGTVAATLPSLSASATGTTPVSYASKVLDLSPLGWWRLGEASGSTMVDSSGNGRDGTYSGSPTLGVADSPLASGGTTVANFDGTDDVGSVSYATWMNQADFTIACWIKTTGGGLMAARDHIDGYPWLIGVSSGAHAIYFPVQGIDTSGTFPAQTDVSANNGAWHFVVGTYNDTSKVVKTYIDGSLIAQATATSNINLTSYFGYGLAIGRRGAGSPAWYTGKLADVAFFGSTLSAANISDLYEAATTTGDVDGTVAATLPSLTASAAGDVALPPVTGTVGATLPSLTASIEGTHTSNDQVGTVEATLPSLTATVDGDYTPPTITGAVHATLPALSAAAAGVVEALGEVHATLPALTASIVDAGANRTGTVVATLPSLSVGVVGEVPVTRGEVWTTDLSQRTLLPIVCSGSATYVAPLAEIPASIVERPITRASVIVPDLTTEAGARVHPVTGQIAIPDNIYDAYPVTRSIIGVPHLIIDGQDVTYFGDSRTQVRSDRAQEPFGDAQLVVDFPQITTLDDKDNPALSWLRVDASVHYVMQLWDEDGPTGVVETLFHGRLVSDDSGNDDTSPQKTWTARGDLWAAAQFTHLPRLLMNPVDIGYQIPKVLNAVTSRRYPKISNVTTGNATLQRGNPGEKVMEYVQGLLGSEGWTDAGRQWTVAKKPGTMNSFEVRLKKNGVDWTVTNGQRGLRVSLSSDSTQSRNVIYGRGQRSDGGVWMNKKFPDAGRTAPAYPFSSPGTVMTIGTTDGMTTSGDGVSTWQRRAKALGFNITVDGVYNSADATVARALQRQYRILVDGIVGPQTWAETFDVGSLGADPDQWVRLPLAWLPGTQPFRYRANGSLIGPDPAYDPSITINSDDVDFGTDVELAVGAISAQQIIDRENPPSLSGQLTIECDPREGSRFHIAEGDRIKLIGYEGRDVVLHVADRDRSWQGKGTVTVQVAETTYDALTLAQIRARNNANRPDPSRRPGKSRTKPNIDPWDCESNAGKIERHALYGGLWTVIRIPMSEYGRLSQINLSTSPATKFAFYIFAKPITSADMIHYFGANPSTIDNPGSATPEQRELIEERFGWINGWGSSGGMLGTWPQGPDGAVTGLAKESGEDYWSPSGYLYLAEWAQSSTFIEGELRAAPPEV